MKIIKHPKIYGFKRYYKENKVMTIKKAIKYQGPNDSLYFDENIHVSVESTISLIINEQYRVNILCTCQQIEALIVGYLVSEGFLSSMEDIDNIKFIDDSNIYISTKNSIEDFFYRTEIHTSGNIGVRQRYEKIVKIIKSDVKITPEIFFNAQKEMNQLSRIWRISGGAHMSGLFQPDGTLLSYAEDIGRHNTLDKIIGEAMINELNVSKCFVVTSGRLSTAMISKLVRVGIPIVISISAPTAQGLELAEKSQITIIGFSRPPYFNLYTFPERIILSMNKGGMKI